jgi:glutathione S-transferase
VTIADIAIVGALFTLFTIILTPKEREAIPKVVKWVQTVGENAAFKKYFGTLRLCTNEWTVPQAEKKEKDAK